MTFKFGLFDCLEDLGTTCEYIWCPCVTHANTQEHLNEGQWWINCCVFFCMLQTCPVVNWLMVHSTRESVMVKYNIERPKRPSTLEAVAVAVCCPCCSAIQQSRECRYQGIIRERDATSHSNRVVSQEPPAYSSRGYERLKNSDFEDDSELLK
eukprot:Awhi_evm1s5531